MLEQHYLDNYRRNIGAMARATGSVHAAEDILHDAYEKVLTYGYAFDGGRPFDYWFNTILRNCLRSWIRSERVQGMSVEIEDDTLGGEECGMETAQLLKTLKEEIEQMENTLHKDVLTLHFVHEVRIVDIPILLEISLSNAKKVVSRFRAKITEKYK